MSSSIIPGYKGKNSNNYILFTTSGFVSIFDAVSELREEGFVVARVHKKLADEKHKDAQLMIVFEKGVEGLPSDKFESLLPFIGTKDGSVAGCSWIVRVRKNEGIPKTSETHLGVPEHILLSCTDPAERKASDNALHLAPAGEFLAVNKIRLSLNMGTELAAVIPSWVEERPWGR
ncbi:MAG: hypothetical protein WAV25_00595 [Minisyncoccia bacterium]